MKAKRVLAVVMCMIMGISMMGCNAGESNAVKETETKETKETKETNGKMTENSGDNETKATSKTEAAAAEDPNMSDYDYVEPSGNTFDIASYYNDLGVECSFKLKSTGGTVKVPDNYATKLPKAKEKYTVGFSVYYTVDEVGAMLLDTMKECAEEAGIELLVNDANYDQDAQNQAVEQWILQKVDGVILAPCDFTGVKEALDSLKDADIPVITFNPALVSEADSVVMSECKEQGIMAAELLRSHLEKGGTKLAGTIVYQSLPFVHPNAATRADGFKSVFSDCPDIEIVELTGTSVEEHYAAFESALMAHPDMIGAFGLYSAATVGMLNAKVASGSDVPLTSIDNDKPILQGIYEGNILGSACYSSISPAFWAMSGMISLLNGVEIPSAYFYENRTVTKENVEEMFEHYYKGKKLVDYIAGEIE